MLNRNLDHGIREYLYSQYVFFQNFTFLIIILLYPLEQESSCFYSFQRIFCHLSEIQSLSLHTLLRGSQRFYSSSLKAIISETLFSPSEVQQERNLIVFGNVIS